MRKNVILFFFAVFFAMSAYGQGWQWGRGSAGAFVDSWAVATDSSGNVFGAGYSNNGDLTLGSYTLPYAVGGTAFRCVIVKYDSSGNFLWAKGTRNGYAYLEAITTDRDGNSFMLGAIDDPSIQIDTFTLTNSSYPYPQYFLIKFDPAGNVIWARNEGGAAGHEIDVSIGGGVSGIRVLGTAGLATDVSGNIYVATNFSNPTVSVGGTTFVNTNPTGNTDDILLVKYDPAGHVVWGKSAGGKQADDAYGLTVTPAGDIYISGVTTSASVVFGSSIISDASGGIGNGFIARFDSTGTSVWASVTGGVNGDFAAGVASDASSCVYVTGGFSDPSISFEGSAISNPYPGNVSLYLAKFDPSNTVVWSKTVGDTTAEAGAWGYCIAMSPCGTIWVSGSFNDVVNIDGHYLASPAGSNDPVFIAGYSSTGTYVQSAALQSGADDQNGIACDATGNVYMCADYTMPYFIVGNDTLKEDTTSTEMLYVAKYTFVNPSTPDTFFTHQDVFICANQMASINAPAGYTGYLWSNGSTGPSINVDTFGTYWVRGNGRCAIVDTITLLPGDGCCKVGMPNAFTPNGDAENDTYYPVFEQGCYVTNYRFSIFNRWGQRVFYSEDPTAQWDGKFLGVNAEMGTYMYQLKYQSGASNKSQMMKGDVTLIR